MQSVNVAVLGGPGARELAGLIAKKGSETDVTQYNLKKGDRSLTLFVPAKYPEKIQGVSYTLQGTSQVLLVVDELNRELGEQIVAADMAGKTKGFLLLRNYIQPEQVQPLLKDTALEGYELLDTDDPAALREMLIELPADANPGDTRVDVDQHFNVKGVGTVVLGVVTRGEVSKHQQLHVFPTKKDCKVRSIQVHDTDVDTAGVGSRVGLALKDIDSDDLDRGNVLAPTGTLTPVAKGGTLGLEVRVPRFAKAGLSDGQVVHVGTGMQFVPAKVAIEGGALAAGASGPVTLTLDNPLVVGSGDRVLLFHLDAKDLRVVGGARVA